MDNAKHHAGRRGTKDAWQQYRVPSHRSNAVVGIVSLSDLALRGPQELYPYVAKEAFQSAAALSRQVHTIQGEQGERPPRISTQNHHVVYHGNECGGSDDGMKFPDLLRDPLIRLVMKSDGVTEQDMLAVMDQLRRDLAEREVACTQPGSGLRNRERRLTVLDFRLSEDVAVPRTSNSASRSDVPRPLSGAAPALDWPERDQRVRAWFSLEMAATLVASMA